MVRIQTAIHAWNEWFRNPKKLEICNTSPGTGEIPGENMKNFK